MKTIKQYNNMETRTIFNVVITIANSDEVNSEVYSFNNENDAKHYLWVQYNDIVESDKKENYEYKSEIVDRVKDKKELDYFYLELYYYGERRVGTINKTIVK